MPLSSAATATELGTKSTSNVVGGLPVEVTLTFDGVAFVPSGLHAALDAAYGTVTLETDAARTSGPYRFRIAP